MESPADLYRTILYYTMLHDTRLYYIILCYTIPYLPSPNGIAYQIRNEAPRLLRNKKTPSSKVGQMVISIVSIVYQNYISTTLLNYTILLVGMGSDVLSIFI